MQFLSQLFRRREVPTRAAEVPAGWRIYVIGDIHGRADLLSQIANQVSTDLAASPNAKSFAIFLGDYVDRGSDSFGVLERLTRQDFPIQFVALRGNHEAMLMAALQNPESMPGWYRSGGAETLFSYGVRSRGPHSAEAYQEMAVKFREVFPVDHHSFLRATALHFEAGDYFFCHAGVRPGVALNAQSEADLLWIRDEFLASRKMFERIIVHGHTPVELPEVLPNRFNIDTGAYISGRLTCLVLEGQTHRWLHTGRI